MYTCTYLIHESSSLSSQGRPFLCHQPNGQGKCPHKVSLLGATLEHSELQSSVHLLQQKLSLIFRRACGGAYREKAMSNCGPCSLQADTCPCKKNVLMVQEICPRNIRTGKSLSYRLLEAGKCWEYACPLFLNFSRRPGLAIVGERGAGLDRLQV